MADEVSQPTEEEARAAMARGQRDRALWGGDLQRAAMAAAHMGDLRDVRNSYIRQALTQFETAEEEAAQLLDRYPLPYADRAAEAALVRLTRIVGRAEHCISEAAVVMSEMRRRRFLETGQWDAPHPAAPTAALLCADPGPEDDSRHYYVDGSPEPSQLDGPTASDDTTQAHGGQPRP